MTRRTCAGSAVFYKMTHQKGQTELRNNDLHANHRRAGDLKCVYAALAKTLVVALMVWISPAEAAHGSTGRPARERDIARAWCDAHGGQAEVILADHTRADFVTEDHAIEFERGRHWAEAIGQSLYYQIQTGKRAGIVLLLERPEDYRYWLRLGTVIREHHLPIDTWKVP